MMSKQQLRILSHALSKKALKAKVEESAGRKYSAAQFDKLLREWLPLESEYQREIIREIRARYPDAFIWKATAGMYAKQGIPDLCVIYDGRFYGFEIKRPYVGRLTKIQEKTLRDINHAGGVAAVISFPEHALALMRMENWGPERGEHINWANNPRTAAVRISQKE